MYYNKTGNPHDHGGSAPPSDSDDDSGMDGTPVENGGGEGYTGRNIVKDLLKDLGGARPHSHY